MVAWPAIERCHPRRSQDRRRDVLGYAEEGSAADQMGQVGRRRARR